MNMQSTPSKWWTEIDRPAGPRPTPDWCRDVHVNSMERYGNSPCVTLRVIGNVFDWAGKVFRREGHLYIAESDDGRSMMYAHDGAIGMHTVRMFRSEDGSIRAGRRFGPEWADAGLYAVTYADGTRAGYEPGEWIEVERLATTQQQGFGGDRIHITLDDGRALILRGPWHVGHLAGYEEVTVVAGVSSPHCKWHQRCGLAGLAIREDVFIALLSRYQPHLPLARIHDRFGVSIEPFQAEWGAPKRFRDRAA